MWWLVIFFLLLLPVQAKRLHPESYYQELWCSENKGQAEFVLEDLTRIDCLTNDKAVEFDFANKWAECVGQASYYGLMTNKTPVCAIIIENKERDAKYIKRLEKLKEKLQFEVIEIVPKDTVTNP